MTRRSWAILAIGAVILFFAIMTADARAEARPCVETGTLAEAYLIVMVPEPQTPIQGQEVQDWLAAFNRLDPGPDIAADMVIFQRISGGGYIALFSNNGTVCKRVLIRRDQQRRILEEMISDQP